MEEPERIAGVRKVERMPRIGEMVSTTGVIRSLKEKLESMKELEFRETTNIQKRA